MAIQATHERRGVVPSIRRPRSCGASLASASSGRRTWWICLSLAVGTAGAAAAEDSSPLQQPPICSVFSQDQVAGPSGFCQIEPSAGGKGRDVVVSLTATTSPTEVAGYRLVTMSYNGSYLAPVVELAPGDTLKVRLLNFLVPLAGNAADGVSHDTMHDPADATNLHTHGLIVLRKNALNPTRGNGDNVFVSLKRGEWLDYSIRIPTELKSSILCKDEPPTRSCAGTMVHPNGLYWYHSHLHGISTAQVAGGMSGLLSIGPRDANLLANAPDAATQAQETSALSQTTDVFYLMLRDIELRSDTKPGATTGVTPANGFPLTREGIRKAVPATPRQTYRHRSVAMASAKARVKQIASGSSRSTVSAFRPLTSRRTTEPCYVLRI